MQHAANDAVPPLPRRLTELVGRAALVRELVTHAIEGHAVVLYGPRGIGASAVLDVIADKIAERGRPVVRIPTLDHLADLTAALADVYLDAVVPHDQRARRALVQEAVRLRPGALLVDRVGQVSVMVRHDLRALAGAGMAAVLVGAVDDRLDHQRLRGLRLAHRELEIPVLDRRRLRKVLKMRLDGNVAAALEPHDRERLLRAASGRPGLLSRMADRLDEGAYWRNGRILVEVLRADAMAVDTFDGTRSTR